MSAIPPNHEHLILMAACLNRLPEALARPSAAQRARADQPELGRELS